MPACLVLIWDIITNLSSVFSIIRSIVALISLMGNPKEKAIAYAKLRDAYALFRKTGDNSQLNSLHNDLAAVAQGPTTVTE